MQSIPVIRLLIMAAALCLAAIGVWNVTQPEATAAGAVPTANQPGTPTPALSQSKSGRHEIAVELTFSQIPQEFSVQTPTGPSVSGKGKVLTHRLTIETEIPTEGADWVVHVQWPNKNADSAVRVRCSDVKSGQKLSDVTFWGKGSVEDVVGIKY